MSEKLTSIRLPDELIARADALVEKLAGNPELALHGKVTRAVILRLAMLRGIEGLEKKGASGKRNR